jgi:hypothetical protein
MPPKRKWTYWYKVTWVDPKNHGNFKVGQIIGLHDRHQKDWPMWKKTRGFFVAARLQYLGKLPCDLEITDPKEAGRRIAAGGWD